MKDMKKEYEIDIIMAKPRGFALLYFISFIYLQK